MGGLGWECKLQLGGPQFVALMVS
jgi:hypothetical protein